VVGHAVGHAVGHGHAGAQQAAVVQLVHWALVVAGHVVVVVAAHESAVTFVAVNSESATNNAITERATFFTVFTSVFCISLDPIRLKLVWYAVTLLTYAPYGDY
jgi:hypothetical protein